MKIMSWDSLFPNVHNMDKGARTRKYDLKNVKWQTLTEDTMFDGICYASGSKYKVFETKNFGWVVFDQESKTPDGNVPGKFIHKY